MTVSEIITKIQQTDDRHLITLSTDGKRILSIGLLWLALLLLSYQLDTLSFSVDEFVNVEIDRGSWREMFRGLEVGIDLHPPLSHIISKLTIMTLGEGEWSIRLP